MVDTVESGLATTVGGSLVRVFLRGDALDVEEEVETWVVAVAAVA
jgi:hypothetical protein